MNEMAMDVENLRNKLKLYADKAAAIHNEDKAQAFDLCRAELEKILVEHKTRNIAYERNCGHGRSFGAAAAGVDRSV